jgi:hypothetical protein
MEHTLADLQRSVTRRGDASTQTAWGLAYNHAHPHIKKNLSAFLKGEHEYKFPPHMLMVSAAA